MPDSAPSTRHRMLAGTEPTPAAMPADSVRMPAPATLFTICSTRDDMLHPGGLRLAVRSAW